MVKVRSHKKVVRKREKPFRRFNSDRFLRLGTSWRRPRGIDNPLRRHYRGYGNMPKIGYRTDKKTRYMDKNGFIRYLVHNVEDLELLMMHHRRYAAVIAHNVGAKLRKRIVQRADELDIKVVNRSAKLKAEETK